MAKKQTSFSAAFNAAERKRGAGASGTDFSSTFNANEAARERRFQTPITTNFWEQNRDTIRRMREEQARREEELHRYSDPLTEMAREEASRAASSDQLMDLAVESVRPRYADPLTEMAREEAKRASGIIRVAPGTPGGGGRGGYNGAEAQLAELNRLRNERNDLDVSSYASGDPAEAMSVWDRQQQINSRISELEKQLKAMGVDTSQNDLNPIDALHSTFWKGISNAAGMATSTLDFANRLGHYALGWTPEEYDAQNTWTSRLNEQQKQNAEYWGTRRNADVQNDPTAIAVSDLGAEVIQAIPAAVLAMTSGGASLGANTASLTAAANSAGVTSGVGQTVNSLQTLVSDALRNPQFYSSFWNVLGNGYENAKADGASEANAVSYALINGGINALIEIGGGIENPPEQLGLRELAKSATEEGMEEVQQGIFERGLQRMYGKQNPVFSLTDENAVLNPAVAAREFGGGALVGGVLGGGQAALNTILNANANREAAEEILEETRAGFAPAETPAEPLMQLAQEMADAEVGREIPEVNREMVRAVAGDPAKLAELGIDPRGKTGGQIRAEVRAALESQRADAVRAQETEAAARANMERPTEYGWYGEPSREPVAAPNWYNQRAEVESAAEETSTPNPSAPWYNTPQFSNYGDSRWYASAPAAQAEALLPEEIRTGAVIEYANATAKSGDISKTMADTMITFYNPAQDAGAYMRAMTATYNAGAKGAPLESVNAPGVTFEQKQAAYIAGQAARNGQRTPAVQRAPAAQRPVQQPAVQQPAPQQTVQQPSEAPAQAQKKPAVRASNPGFVQDAVSDRAKLTHLQKRTLDTIGKTLGVRVRMVESIDTTDADGNVRKSGAQGYYDNGEIVLARDADDPYLTTAVHESIHRIRELSEADYTYLSNFVKRNMSDERYGLAGYIKAQDGYTSEEIPEEIVADAFGRILGNEQAMRQFVAENSTAAQRIMDVFADIFDRIKRALSGGNVKSLTENQRKVYEDLAGRMDVMLKYYQDAVDVAKVSEGPTQNNSKQKFSLRSVPPAEPTSNQWKRGATYDEVKSAHPTLYELSSEEQDTRNPTQISGTVKTDQKGNTADSIQEELNNAGLVLTSKDNNKNNQRINAWIKENYPDLYGRVNFSNDKTTGTVTVKEIMRQTAAERQNEEYRRNAEKQKSISDQNERDGIVYKSDDFTDSGLIRSFENRDVVASAVEDYVRNLPGVRDVSVHKSGGMGSYETFYITATMDDGDSITIRYSGHGSRNGGADVYLWNRDYATIPQLLKDVDNAIKKNGMVRYSTKITPKQDADYAAAVERGDTETAQRMVDEAAKAAGYTIKVYRGGGQKHNVFDTNRGAGDTQFGPGTYFTDAQGLAEDWAKERAHTSDDNGYVGEYYIKANDLFSDDSTNFNTEQWKNVERALKNRGVSDRDLKRTRNWGFYGIAMALQSVGEIEEGSFTPFSWRNATKVNQILRDAGYDGIEGPFYDSRQYVIFDPAQAKSADPVTYDDAGNVIPLSDRFNPEYKDIRYSTSDRDILDAYVEKYGAIKTGENPTRDVTMPKRTTDKTKVGQTIRTIAEAGVTTEPMLKTIEEMVTNHDFDYPVYSDEAAIQKATEIIQKRGYQDALSDWKTDVKNGGVSKTNTALGWALYNNAVTSRDIKAAAEIAWMMSAHERSAGQALQAARILKNMSPEGRLYAIQRSVHELQDDLNKRYGNKAPGIKLNEDQAELFLNAETEAQREVVEKKMREDITEQVPLTFMDRWTAFRYTAMLGNIRTIGRNILGNAGFAPIVLTKDLIATAIEGTASVISDGKFERTKGNVLGRGDLLKAAWNDYAGVQEAALGERKYSDSLAKQQTKDRDKIFGQTRSKVWNKTGGAALEAWRKGTNTAMEKTDVWFNRPQYVFALAQYCAANGISAEQIKSGKGLDKAREYAIREAQKATYRYANDFSQMVSSLGKNWLHDKNVWKRIVATLGEGVAPFRNTPANIVSRIFEYSPAGLLKAITYDSIQMKKGNMSAADMIDDLSAGLTGTGLVAFGVYLAAQGLLRGRGGRDKKKREFDELQGHQDYALELPNGTSVTLDWLAPQAIPIFIGVNLYEAAQENKALRPRDIMSAVFSVTEPVLSMSMLQSLNDLLTGKNYGGDEETPALVQKLASGATSYITQAVPTLLGQIERSAETKRMTTYAEKNDQYLTGDLQYTLGKISAKIPGIPGIYDVDYRQIPYIDAWGREETTGEMLLIKALSGTTVGRIYNNFIRPSFVSKIDESDMEKELMRLYEATGEDGVLPRRANKYITVDKARKDLTGNEYVIYASAKGQTSYVLAGRMTESAAYKAMSDDKKVEAIQDCYTYADQTANTLFGAKIPDKYSWVKKAQTGEQEYKISPEKYIEVKRAVSDIEGLKDANGKTIVNSEGLLKMQAIYGIPGLNDEQRKYLFECFGVGKTVIGYNKALVDQKLKEMKQK